MALERFGVGNYEAWGRLVKTWATGKDYINGDGANPAPAGYYPPPTTIGSFRSMVMTAGCNPKNLDIVTKLDFVHVEGPHHLVIRLAEPGMITASEAILTDPTKKNYGLPEFYKDMFVPKTGGGVAEREVEPQDKLDNHARRIGDYTLSICI